MTDDSQAHPNPGSAVAAALVALLVFSAAVAVYYAMLAAVSVLSITAAVGYPGTSDPAWLERAGSLLLGALVFAGPLWGFAAASLVHGAFAQPKSRSIWTRVTGFVRVLGIAAMTACLGLWPALFVRPEWSLEAAMLGMLVGFIVGAAVMLSVEMRLGPAT